MISDGSGDIITGPVLEFLARFDTSTTNHLEVTYYDPPSEYLLGQALLPMKNLHSLTVLRCENLLPIIHVLNPDISSSSILICPKLEELRVYIYREEDFDVDHAVEMAAARASRGAKLKFVRVVSSRKHVPVDVSELCRYVSCVEYDFKGGEEVGDYDDHPIFC